MGIFDKHAAIFERHEAARATGPMPTSVVVERMLSATEAVIDGRTVVTAGTHNYLGMAFDEAVVAAGAAALARDGAGTCGSRIANGSYAEHAALEAELAAFHGMADAMVFSTGYQANLGIISTLVGAGDTLLLDADSHASIYDSCRQTQATALRFRHNDPENLAARLRRLEGQPGTKLVVVEGIYSMLGDVAPLREIARVCKQYGAYCLVDEAHSMGVMGPNGGGLADELGVVGEVDFIVGTFSKSLGGIGGYCASSLPGFGALRVTCRPYMFTASLPPATVATVRRALKTVTERPELRRKLWRNVERLYAQLEDAGLSLGPTPSPIVAVCLPSDVLTVMAWRLLLERGYYVNVGLPPATPSGESLLRCALSASHSDAQIDGLAAAIIAVAEQVGVSGAPVLASAVG